MVSSEFLSTFIFIFVNINWFLFKIKIFREINRQELYYISTLLKDLCSDTITKSHVSNYDHFETKLHEALKV